MVRELKHKKFITIFLLLFFLVSISLVAAELSFKYDHGKLIEENFDVKIQYLSNINSNKELKNVFDGCYSHGKTRVFIDSKKCPELNKPAWVTLKDTEIPFTKAIVVKDGRIYDTQLFLEGGTSYKFLSNGFSTYTIETDDWNGTHYNTEIVLRDLRKEPEYRLHMKMNVENDSTNVIDDSFLENNGTIGGSPIWQPESPREWALSIEDDVSFIEFPNNAEINEMNESNHSISLWLKNSGIANDIIFQHSFPPDNTGFETVVDADGTFFFSHYAETGSIDLHSIDQINDSLWHNAIINIDTESENATLYIDGIKQVSDDAWSGIASSSEYTMKIGNSMFASNMSVDKFHMLSRILTDEEITTLSNKEELIDTTGLIVRYAMQETDNLAGAVEDISGNGYDATLNGTANVTRGGVSNEQGSYIFDGTNDHIDIPMGTWRNTTEMMTSFWIKPTNVGNKLERIFYGTTIGGAQALTILTDGTAKGSFTWDWGSTGTVTTAVLENDTWYHLAFTYDNDYSPTQSERCIYLDGASVGCSISIPLGGFLPLNNVGWIGGYAGARFTGSISEPIFTETNKNSTEITDLFEIQQSYGYKSEGIFISDEISFTDYDPQIQVNIMHNITFNGVCTNILQIDYGVGVCGTTISPVESATWNEATCTAQTPTNNVGNCTVFSILADSSTTNTFNLKNYSIFSNRYYLPSVTNVSIEGGANMTQDIVVGSAYYTLNDTDSGYIYYEWYVNDVWVKETKSALLTNGSFSNATLEGMGTYFLKDDLVYAILIPENTYINGTPVQTDTVTTGNADFSITSYLPITQNLTLTQPERQNFKLNLNDVDGDVVVTWNQDGTNISTGNTFTYLSTDYDQGIHEFKAIATDGQFKYTAYTWNIDIQTQDLTLAMILGLGIFSFIIIFFSMHLNEEHIILKILFVTLALGALILIPATFINGWVLTRGTFFKVAMWAFRIFIMYFFGYLFWYQAKKWPRIQKEIEKWGKRKQ